MHLPAVLRPEPDSLVSWLSQGGRKRAQLWFPLVHLVWLFWMVAAPFVVKPARPWVIAATFASLPLFLLLYQRAWCGPRRQFVPSVAGMAVLGLAMVPVNSSWSYIIYAASLIPFAARGWRSAGWVALLLAAFMAVALATPYFNVTGALMAAGMTATIATLNILFRASHERDAELRLSQDEVRRLATAAERERIARDLHDLLGHTWSLVAVKAELARKLMQRDVAAAERELADIERVARQSLAQVRDAVSGMRAPALAAELASARLMLEAANIHVEWQGVESPPALTTDAETALAMGLREAVTNVQRHARASRVQVLLQADGQAAELSVQDNGRGAGSRRGNGLAGMEERLRALGGRLLLESTPGRGTLLRMQVPLGTGSLPSLATGAAP
jgi:two-component system sensor histidine kinase DesK